MNRKKLKDVANKIALYSKSWNQQFEVLAPAEVNKRRKSVKNFKSIIKLIISFVIRPKMSDTHELYIFEGLRYKEYIKIFKPEQVVIIGSYDEKVYAKKNGYRFIWSFPIESAIYYKNFLNFDYPLINQLKYWLDAFPNSKRIIFFLYEDTQPLGTFLVQLGKMMDTKAISVCIQHGIFYNMKYPIRVDGELSDINFIWDINQVDIIKCDGSKAYEIGLPYMAKAKLSEKIKIILIGTGTSKIGNDYYENNIKIYERIYNKLIKIEGIEILYRPHPNEWTDHNEINILNNIFLKIDKSEKFSILNGPAIIFIGTISSFIYEAYISGHPVARLKVQDEITCEVVCDFTFEEEEIDDLVAWIKNINEKGLLKTSLRNDKRSLPIDRFISALHSAKIC